jgi:nucleoside 2-deoxyribosyltransferase
MRIYLAGPLGFSEAGRHFQSEVLMPALTQLGHEILDPWQLSDPQEIAAALALPFGPRRRVSLRSLNADIGARNVAAIGRSQLVVAVLDGVDVDSGTAAEIGYAFAKRKTILGYRGDFRAAAENEELSVNLQVEYFIRQSGGDIARDLEALLGLVRTLSARRGKRNVA